MTASMVEALEKIRSLRNSDEKQISSRDATEDNASGNHHTNMSQHTRLEPDEAGEQDNRSSERGVRLADRRKDAYGERSGDPNLSSPAIGNPISHEQITDLSQEMRSNRLEYARLEDLLKGAKIYVPPPSPKTEPTSEYKALMARLRREEEARTYERMTNPPPPMESFTQRFPASSAARAFSSSYQNTNGPDTDDDDVTYKDVDRQMALIFNVLISIVCCAAAIWIAAKWWSTPMRLALSMSGSALVGVAEVVVYSGYIRRVSEAKGKEKQVKEVKEIVNTWTVGPGTDSEGKEASVLIGSKDDDDNDSGMKARQRKRDIS